MHCKRHLELFSPECMCCTIIALLHVGDTHSLTCFCRQQFIQHFLWLRLKQKALRRRRWSRDPTHQALQDFFLLKRVRVCGKCLAERSQPLLLCPSIGIYIVFPLAFSSLLTVLLHSQRPRVYSDARQRYGHRACSVHWRNSGVLPLQEAAFVRSLATTFSIVYYSTLLYLNNKSFLFNFFCLKLFKIKKNCLLFFVLFFFEKWTPI